MKQGDSCIYSTKSILTIWICQDRLLLTNNLNIGVLSGHVSSVYPDLLQVVYCLWYSKSSSIGYFFFIMLESY